MKTLITSGQKEQAVRVVVDGVRKGMEEVVDGLVKTGAISPANFQLVLAQGNTLVAHLISEAKVKMIELAEQKVGYLKLISGGEEIIISETDGEDIINYAKNIFPGFSDPDFANCQDNKDQPTKEIKVRVFEQIRNGTSANIFGGFGENLDRLCLTRGQIIRFVECNSKWFGMRDCFTTSFLFKKNGKYSVARVYNGGGMLKVFADSLSSDHFCVAKDHYRFVVPQL